MIRGISGSILDKSDLDTVLFNNPLTYPFKLSEDGDLHFVTFIPVAEEANRYEHWKVLAFPTFQDGVFTNTWKRADVPVRHYLKREKRHIPFRKEELTCLQSTSELPCTLCLRPEATIEINDCTRSILEGTDALQTCTVQHLTNVSDHIYRLNKTAWAFVDSNPGEITEICDSAEPRQHKLALTHSGIIQVNPDCQYTMTNTPVTIEEVDDDMDIVISHRNEITYHQYNPIEDSIFKHHVKSYGLHYFLSLTGIVLFMISSTILYCAHQRRLGNRARNPIGIRNRNPGRVQNRRGFEMPVIQFIRRGGIEFIN
jgi:hypothetical protein